MAMRYSVEMPGLGQKDDTDILRQADNDSGHHSPVKTADTAQHGDGEGRQQNIPAQVRRQPCLHAAE